MTGRDGNTPEAKTHAKPNIEPFDPGKHHRALLATLAAMRGDLYPGPSAGANDHDAASWLTSIPLNKRWCATCPTCPILGGHVALSPAGTNAELAGCTGTAVEITRLFTHPHHRRAGTGRALLRYATAEALQLADNAILLVNAQLTAAINLYHSEHWHPVNTTFSTRTGDRLIVYRWAGTTSP